MIIICLHTAIWFHVFLSNTNNFQNRCICLIDCIQTSTISLSQSEPRSNGNEGLFHTPQNKSLTIRCSLVSYLRHNFLRGSCPSSGDTVKVFYAPLTEQSIFQSASTHSTKWADDSACVHIYLSCDGNVLIKSIEP